MNNKDTNNDLLLFNFIGLRTIKTIIAVFICLLISHFRKSDPIHSLVASIICMKGSTKLSLESGFERLIGTIIGGIYGLITILISRHFEMNVNGIPYYILIAVMLIPVIYSITSLKVPDSVSLGAIVFLSVTVSMALTADMAPFIYVVDRVFETVIGIVVSVAVNAAIWSIWFFR